MEVKLFRSEALELFSYFLLFKLSYEDRESILMDLFSEDDEYEKIVDFNDPSYNSTILQYLTAKNKGVTNSYVAGVLGESISRKIIIVGNPELLDACPCCFYRTLEKRGEYSICPVCSWEDDGSDIAERYSPSNRMTLNEARTNFSKLGVIAEGFHKRNNDATLMYPRLID